MILLTQAENSKKTRPYTIIIISIIAIVFVATSVYLYSQNSYLNSQLTSQTYAFMGMYSSLEANYTSLQNNYSNLQSNYSNLQSNCDHLEGIIDMQYQTPWVNDITVTQLPFS
jgi:flagellar basal body-associated protein FliL